MMLSKLHKFRSLAKTDFRALLTLAVAAPLIEVGLHTFGFKAVYQALHYLSRTVTSYSANPEQEVERHQRLMSIVSRHHPFAGQCLAQSLTLWWALRRKGVETELMFGVRKQDAQFEAHAWVEHRGIPLDPSPQVRRHYSAFAQPITLHEVHSS